MGTLVGQRTEQGLERRRAAAGMARRLAAFGAVPETTATVGTIGVEALFDSARDQSQSAAVHSGFNGLKVDAVVGAAADETVDLGADVGCEAPAQKRRTRAYPSDTRIVPHTRMECVRP